MRRGKVRFYLALAVLLLLAAALLPSAINLLSEAMVNQILDHRETGTGTETEIGAEEVTEMDTEKKVAVLGAAGTKPEETDAGKTDQKASEAILDEEAESQESYMKNLQNYIADFHPENIFYLSMAEEDRKFLKDLEPEFLRALAEHLYSLYADQVRISQVVIQGMLGSDSDEFVFCFTVETDDGETEGFYCSYDREQNYFRLYSMFIG